MKLGIRSLFQSIERLVELAKMVGKIIVNRVLWLSHMNIFKKIAIKEGVLHIKFANNLAIGDNKDKDNANSGGFHK